MVMPDKVFGPLAHAGDGEPAPGGTARPASRRVSDAARSLVAASSATGWSDGSPATATIVCGSSASITVRLATVRLASVRITTLQGSGSPILRPVLSA